MPKFEDKKRVIREKSKSLFIQHGKQVSMHMIADAVGLSNSSLYYYYKNIPEIIDSILNDEYHDFSLTELRCNDLEKDPFSVLKEMSILITEFYYDNVTILRVILSQISPLTLGEDYIDNSIAINHYLNTYKEANESLERVIQYVIDSGQFSCIYSSGLILQTIRGFIFGIFAASVETKPRREDIPHLVENFLSMYKK